MLLISLKIDVRLGRISAPFPAQHDTLRMIRVYLAHGQPECLPVTNDFYR